MLTIELPWAWRAVAMIVLGTALFALGWIKGEAHADLDALQRDNRALSAAATQIMKLQDDARASERDHALNLTAISANFQKELQDARTLQSADRAALRAGALRLRDPGIRTDACPGAAAAAASGAGRCDGGAGGQLSDAAAGFLLDLASEADDVARQLSACQRIVVEDRRSSEP